MCCFKEGTEKLIEINTLRASQNYIFNHIKVVNRAYALPSLHGGSLEISLTVPLILFEPGKGIMQGRLTIFSWDGNKRKF